MTAYRYVRTGRLPARNANGRWEVDEADLTRFSTGTVATGRRGEPDWTQTRARMLAMLLAGDEAGVWTITESCIASGAQPSQIYLEVLGPCLREVGHLWEQSDIERLRRPALPARRDARRSAARSRVPRR
jgi:hypothetical protein